VTHVPIALLEAAATGAIVVALLRFRPDLVAGLNGAGGERRITVLVMGLFGIALAVAGFVAPFASRLPDGLETTATTLRFATRAQAPWSPLAAIAPAVMGVIGTAAAAALAWAFGRKLKTANDDAHR